MTEDTFFYSGADGTGTNTEAIYDWSWGGSQRSSSIRKAP